MTTEAVDQQGSAPPQSALRRADGVELIGEMVGSGYRVPPSLARRADGQTIQLTPLLYALLREVDGQRSAADVSAAVSESTGRPVSEENVRHLVDEKLRPLGLLVDKDGSQPELKKRNPLLGLRFRYVVTDADRTRRLTDPFTVLFRPVVVTALLVAFAVVCWWVFLRKGLASAAYDAFDRPGLLLLVFAVTVVSAGFHEFGHAAAARYGGATPGVMGFGLYLVWPAFYTDVTDSYRLGRAGRLRTDLGGLYFNAIVAVGITGLWMWLRYDALLLVVATQIIQMLRQLAPLVRFDGYHVLADLTGVPDLYGRIKPTLLSVLPWRWGDPHARLLKPWARIVVTLWVVIVVPLLALALWGAIVGLPRLIGTAWASLGKQHDVLSAAWADGDMIQAAARVLAMAIVVVTVASILYMMIRFTRRSIVGVRHATAGKPMKQMLAGVAGVALMTAIAWAWWPNDDNYRPIQASERGTIGDIFYALRVESTGGSHTVSAASQPAAASSTLVRGRQGVMRAVWDMSSPPPTKENPQLAVILVPRTGSASVAGGGGGFVATPAAKADDGWVFPVDKPLAPEKGDNQALAVNTTDNTVEYDAAFAMVYVEGSEAMNVNEAHAYASCESCGAVAVAYQVVIVLDTDQTDDNIAAPQNLAGALNYDCVNCMTYALAQQLFITIDEPLSAEQKRELDKIWREMKAYQAQVERGKQTPEQIEAKLDEFNDRIIEVVEPNMASPPTSAPPTTGSPDPSVTSSPSPPSGTVAPSPSPSSAPTATEDATAQETESTGSTTDSSAGNDTVATSPDGSSSTEPTSSGTTTDGSASTDTDSGGTTSGGTASDGSTSGDSTSGDTTSP